jgi:hypothetical protein
MVRTELHLSRFIHVLHYCILLYQCVIHTIFFAFSSYQEVFLDTRANLYFVIFRVKLAIFGTD